MKTNYIGTRMVKDGEDWQGLQTTKLKNLGLTFQDGKPWGSSFITGTPVVYFLRPQSQVKIDQFPQ